MKLRLASLVLLVIVGSLSAQNTSTIGVLPDNGAALPATCVIGQIYFKTSAPIGLNQCTAANTWTVIPLSSGAGTVTNTGGSLTSNAVVLGAGGNDTKVSTGITSNGASELDLGVATGAVGVLGLNGSTSGKFTHTVNATGTSDSLSGLITWPTGLGAINHILGPTDSSFQISNGGSQNININSAGAVNIGVSGSSNNYLMNTTGLSPAADNTRSLGVTGGNSWKNIASYLYQTGSNCAAVGTAANPSVASCTAAVAGSFSCATNASTGTCTVNTTAVTANSEIFIEVRNDTTTGTRLGVTCNTGITTTLPEVSAVVAATSFTINLGTFTTNPECFSYLIIN